MLFETDLRKRSDRGPSTRDESTDRRPDGGVSSPFKGLVVHSGQNTLQWCVSNSVQLGQVRIKDPFCHEFDRVFLSVDDKTIFIGLFL